MKERRRNISGIRFFHQFPGERRGQATCFEELPEEKQDEIMDQLGAKRLRHLAKELAKSLIRYADLVEEVGAI